MKRAAILCLFLSVPLLGCGADFWAFQSVTSGTNPGTSFVAVWISDSPVDAVDAVHVTVERVELTGPDGVEVLTVVPASYDLLTLQNGMRALLVEAQVPAVSYSAIRLTLADTGSDVPRIEIDGAEYPLGFEAPRDAVVDVPFSFTPPDGGSLEVQMDFNARLSVIQTGSHWTLRPRVSAVAPQAAARADGIVLGSLGLPLSGAVVSAQQGGAEILSARTLPDGSYRLGPLPLGTYDLVVTATGHAPSTRTGLVASAPGSFTVDAITLDPVGSGRVEGIVVGAGPGTTVMLKSDGALIAFTGMDPVTGAFVLDGVPAGTYEVEVWGATGPPIVLPPIAVTAGSTVTVP